MSDDDSGDDFADDYTGGWPRRGTTIASLRRVHCDCAIELRPSEAAVQDATTRIEAHRAVLAGATYFAALFEHADPDRVEQKSPDGKRILCAVYTVDVPFSANSLAFLIDCLYTPHCLDGIGNCEDPVDVVQASLFVGMPNYCTAGLIEAALVRIFKCVAKTRDADSVVQLGAFVRHLLGSDITHDLKIALVERTLGILAQTDREAIAAEHADLIPATHYRPEAVVGTLVTDESGCRWRTLRIAVDNLGATNDAATIAWQGLVFAVGMHFPDYDNDPSLTAEVSCAPEGETLGAWPWAKKMPDGVVDVESRAVRIKVQAYHPTRGRSTAKTCGAWGTYKRPSQQDTVVERVLPKGASLAPFAFDRGPGSSVSRARRATRSAHLAKYESGTYAMRRLVACEVEIQVEETHS
ncbi:BTB domain containing protein [Pandoravirus quercus]|uniref:BTB domain containing protein n=2 Tax=Pandoravirus TaxID=2060084 RepID=A0A2U7U8I2_9VIRU|nr:BTB domain containing protein [Pandoravirus quercus]AVK74751.1 BTB domain containing protein [Pandoravirus quercus]QBZ80928.1 BTB domain containing protein [Pandoravirus celtis]